MPRLVLAVQHEETGATAAPWLGKDVTKLSGKGESTGPRKGLIRLRGRLGAMLRAVQGIRRTRPLARRALRTFRPFLVALRARKPWVRARLMRLGWKVRFMLGAPEVASSGTRLSPALKGAET